LAFSHQATKSQQVGQKLISQMEQENTPEIFSRSRILIGPERWGRPSVDLIVSFFDGHLGDPKNRANVKVY